MPAKVYSERFLHGRSAVEHAQTLVVPTDKRAVVRSIVVISFDVAVAYVVVSVGGSPVAWINTMPINTTRVWDMRAVAYEGETIVFNVSAQDCAWHVSGFLFTDT